MSTGPLQKCPKLSSPPLDCLLMKATLARGWQLLISSVAQLGFLRMGLISISLWAWQTLVMIWPRIYLWKICSLKRWWKYFCLSIGISWTCCFSVHPLVLMVLFLFREDQYPSRRLKPSVWPDAIKQQIWLGEVIICEGVFFFYPSTNANPANLIARFCQSMRTIGAEPT